LLYTDAQLLDGFDSRVPGSYTEMFDFRMYREYLAAGGAAPGTLGDGLVAAVHDAEISQSLRQFLREREPKLVGVMGGHGIQRDAPQYAAVAHLAKHLGEAGFMIVSGGGPGVMEAAHLGAAVARQDDAILDNAIAALAETAALPDLSQVLDEHGEVRAGAAEVLTKAHGWLAAAVAVRDGLPAIAESLAIPTWRYGQEPTMPFATAYAKYFQNSIREEALVQQARAGIVYARGGGGTIREIFEDLEDNFYAPDVAHFTPMIFFDHDRYWQQTADATHHGIKLDQTITDIVRVAHAKPGPIAPYLNKLLFSTEHDVILACLSEHAPKAHQTMMRMVA
jgi:predicted Rossmann-fold nucleotide-binding protein